MVNKLKYILYGYAWEQIKKAWEKSREVGVFKALISLILAFSLVYFIPWGIGFSFGPTIGAVVFIVVQYIPGLIGVLWVYYQLLELIGGKQ